MGVKIKERLLLRAPPIFEFVKQIPRTTRGSTSHSVVGMLCPSKFGRTASSCFLQKKSGDRSQFCVKAHLCEKNV